MSEYKIRDVRIEDANRLVEIYSYYVSNTAVSFEYDVPSVSEFENRIKHTTEAYPYLVCEKDNKIVGYVYAGAYSTREAYTWTATTSIYIDKEYRRQLAGVAYSENEDEYLSHDSEKFHIHQGYTEVAHIKTVGKKFDRWYDLKWFQKKI